MFDQWVGNIVGVAILGVLMDMIIPKGNLKTYTRFFVGLITLIIILHPVLDFIGKLAEFESRLLYEMKALDIETVNTENGTLGLVQNAYFDELYKKRIEDDVVRRVRKYVGETHVSASVTIGALDTEEVYAITKLDILIGDSNISRVKPIGITISDKTKDIKFGEDIDEGANPPIPEEDRTKYRELKTYLSNTYEIEESRIYINNQG